MDLNRRFLCQTFFLVLALLLFSACGSDDSGDSSNSQEETTKESEISQTKSTKNFKYWGEWKSVRNSETLYISTKTTQNITEIEEDLIKIGSEYYIRLGSRNVNLKGSLYEDGTGRAIQNYRDIGGIEIILENLLDSNIQTEITSKDDGTFKDNSLPTGDYKISVSVDDLKVDGEVSLIQEEEDIGAFKLVPKNLANFKSTFYQTNYIFGDGQKYNGYLLVKNIGEDVGRGVTYSLTLDGATTFEVEPSLGSIPIGDTKIVPLSFSFPKQSENLKNYTLKVEIKDANNRQWNDEVHIPVHKGFFTLEMRSENSISGTLQDPNDGAIEFSGFSKSVKLPLIDPSDSYYLAFTNYGDYATEGIYGLALDSTIGTFTNFTETRRYEPNNDKESATSIKVGENVINYLHFEDIDFWKISTPEKNELFDSSEKIEILTVARIEFLAEKQKQKEAKAFLKYPREYSRNSNGVVSDGYGLQWEDHGESFEGNFSEAETYCSNLNLDEKTDWRLPTNKELWYLADRSKSNPAISEVFQNVINIDDWNKDFYWSNQQVTYTNYEDYNWALNSYQGYDGWKERSESGYARCVRGESFYEDIQFERDDSRNVVVDQTHNLEWEDGDFPEDRMSWYSAKSHCSNLNFGGYSDWRLPTIEELYSITDQRINSAPYIDNNFQNIKSDWYWSQTINKTDSSKSWVVGFYNGDESWDYQTGSNFAVCVRDF
jgi:hypothetical protein